MPPISMSKKVEMDLDKLGGIGSAANIRERINENEVI